MKKDQEEKSSTKTDSRISELLDLIEQKSLELNITTNEQKRAELLANIKDFHKEIKRIELSFLKIRNNNH